MNYTEVAPLGAWVLLSFGIGFCLFGLAALVYVAFRFMAVVTGLEISMLRELMSQRRSGQVVLNPVAGMGPAATEGSFEPYDEQHAYVQERAAELRREGLAPEELDAFMQQAVADEVGKTDQG